MPPKQAYAVANSMDGRGELEEDLVTEEEEQQIKQLEDRLSLMISNLSSLKELPNFSATDKDSKKRFLTQIRDSILSQLIGAEKSSQERADTEKDKEAEELAKELGAGELTEMSGMAGGAVAGYSGPLVQRKLEDEQKTTTA